MTIGKARNYDIVRVSKTNFNNNAVGVQRLNWKGVRAGWWLPHPVVYYPSYQIASLNVHIFK
jgi:hypothetical protein